MKENDDYSTKLCSNCIYQLKLAYSFKEQCLKSQQQFWLLSTSKISENIDESINFEHENDIIIDTSAGLDVKIERKLEENDSDSDNYEVEVLDETCDIENEFYVKKNDGFECKVCKKLFEIESLCEFHVIKHQKIKKCMVCGVKFKRKYFYC